MTPKVRAAIAVCCFASAPAAHAQFGDVTLYGRFNLGVERVSRDIPDSPREPSTFRVSSNTSLVGIRGSEPLSGGLAAVFQLESSIQLDSGSGILAGRESFVGLRGPWGTFKLGNFLAPYDDLHPIFGNAPTLTSSILSTAALWSQGAADKVTGGFDARLPNSIRYDTPAIAGITASIQYSTLENVQHANVASAGIFYSSDTALAGVAYERNYQARGDGLNDSAFSVAGSYSFGLADIAGVYEHLSYETPLGTLRRKLWGASTTVSALSGVVYAFYGRAGEGTGSAPDGTRISGLAKGPDTSSEQWELSYTYSLSRRTLLYAGYVRIDNRSNASYTFAINPYPVPIGGKLDGWVLGMAHFF